MRAQAYALAILGAQHVACLASRSLLVRFCTPCLKCPISCTQAYALAILGAEYVARLLPPGTHDWSQFVTPSALSSLLFN